MKILLPFFVFRVSELPIKAKGLLLLLFFLTCLNGLIKAQEGVGITSFTSIDTLSTNEVNVIWPTNFPHNSYFLYIKVWTEETVKGEKVQVQNNIYNLSKTDSGFTVRVKNPIGYLYSYATDSATMAPNQVVLWKDTVTSITTIKGMDEY